MSVQRPGVSGRYIRHEDIRSSTAGGAVVFNEPSEQQCSFYISPRTTREPRRLLLNVKARAANFAKQKKKPGRLGGILRFLSHTALC